MRVLLVRARAEAERSAERVRAAGWVPLVAPVLRIVPLPGEMPGAGDGFDGAIVTSPHAVGPVVERAPQLRALPALAVGRRTAQALREAGFGQVRAFADAAELVRDASDALPARATLLHAAGRHRKPEPAAGLERAGHAVKTWTVYAAEPEPTLPATVGTALRDGELQAAMHYSRRSAAILSGLVAAAGLSGPFGRLVHLCLSADVADGLGPVPGRIVVADAPNETRLLADLARLHHENSAGSPLP